MVSASSDDAVTSDCITKEQLMYLKNRWSCTRDQMHLWLWKLDSSLPGFLGQISDWLCHAEEQIRAMPCDEYDSPSNAVNGIQQQLADISVKLAACFINCLCTFFRL